MRYSFTILSLLISLSAKLQQPDPGALKKILPNSSTAQRLEALSFLGQYYVQVNPDSALFYANWLSQEAKKNDSTRFELLALNTQAYVFSNMGNKDRSLNLLLQGLARAEASKDSRMVYLFTSNISLFYQDNKDPRNALTYALKGLQILINANRVPEQGRMFAIIASIYFDMGKPDSARYYVGKAIETEATYPGSTTTAQVHDLQGRLEASSGKLPLALEYYRITLSEYRQILFMAGVSDISLRIAKLFQKLGREDSTLHYAMNAHQVAVNHKLMDQQLQANDFLYHYYSEAGKTHSAYKYLAALNDVKDSLYAQDKARTIEELGFNERLRQQEIAETKKAEAEERKSNLQLAAIAIFIPTFFLLVLILSRKVKRKMIDYLGIVALLLVFEFINLLLHPYIVKVTSHNNIFILAISVALAALLVPIHHKLEHWVKEYTAKKQGTKPATEPPGVQAMQVAKITATAEPDAPAAVVAGSE